MREVKDLHLPFIAYLRKRGIPYIYHRPDRRSGIAKGHPDFTILWEGRAYLIEFKTPDGKLSEDQENRFQVLLAAKCPTIVCTSLEGAIARLESWIGETPYSGQPEAKAEPSVKEWVKKTRQGAIVVTRYPDLKFIRMATDFDVRSLPVLPVGL